MWSETLVVPEDLAGTRLDDFLARALYLPKEEARRLVGAGRVTVRGRKPSHLRRLSAGEEVRVERKEPTKVPAVGPDLTVLYDDASCLVVAKPAGLPVEPAGPNSASIVGAASRLGGFNVNGRAAPGLAHRLDRDTSGALLLARTDQALAELLVAFQKGQVEKDYLALVASPPEKTVEDGKLDTPYGRDPKDSRRFTTHVVSARRARLSYRVAERFSGALLLKVRLETGRTHQIRVQLLEAGLPVLGDTVYGVSSSLIARQALHAERLSFPSPDGRLREVRAPLPADFEEALARLRTNS